MKPDVNSYLERTMSLLTFHNLGQSFADADIFTGLNASVPNQARIGLVGPNGIGKTSLLRILAGESRPATGQIHLAKGIRIGYSQQEAMRAFSDQENTVYEEMLTVFDNLRAREEELRQMEERMGDDALAEGLMEHYGAAQEAFELAGGYDYDVRIQQVLDGLGLKRHQWQMPLSHCSGGQKTRALLARLLLEKPDLLVLDEPTNHLDVSAIEWLENRLHTWSGAILVVSHDRYFLDKVVNHIWEMSANGIEPYRGNYSAYVGQRQERWARRDEEFTAVKERFLKELDFVKRNIARASSTDRAKGQLRRLIRSVKAVEKGGVRALDQSWLRFHVEGPGITGEKWNIAEVERRIKALRSPNPAQTQLKMRLQPAHRSGRIILRAKDLVIGYPGTPLFHADEIELFRQERVALIGPNGTGKTTFLRTLMNEVEPLDGRIHLGASLDISTFSQAHENLNPQRSALEELLSHRAMPTSQARNYLARYLFRGDDVFKQVRMLSGGERGRLALAILALDDANFLLLDEPTNHLDIPAQEVLQDALIHFEGTVLLVTHDRYLVDKLATQIWDLRNGRLQVHRGGYHSYLAAREHAEERAKQDRQQKKAAANANGRLSAEAAARKRAKALSETEFLIQKMETKLQELGQELESLSMAIASGGNRPLAQEWERLSSLTQGYDATQEQLDALISKWEALSINT
jgi:ATP-binding cassette subfamily F protein 3